MYLEQRVQGEGSHLQFVQYQYLKHELREEFEKKITVLKNRLS